jgi:hypothetical protein
MHFAQLRVFACYSRIQLTLFPATLGLLWPYCHLACAISLPMRAEICDDSLIHHSRSIPAISIVLNQALKPKLNPR